MYNILTIAKAFQTYGSMSPKKLQKLCYYAYAWDKALEINKIKNTNFEAWVHGPVSPSIYHNYKVDGSPYFIPELSDNLTDLVEDEETAELIRQIWRLYGEKTGEELEAMTHMEQPWLEARNGLNAWESSNNPIKEDTMKRYYSRLLDEHGQ